MFAATDKAKLFPLQLNEATGEPYLQLPSPHERIRITPIRQSDVEMAKTYLNDPRVYEYLAGPPFPYTEEHANGWISRSKSNSDAVFDEIMQGNKFVGGCPVRSIRELQEDGTEVFIGDIGIDRESPNAPWVDADDAENMNKKAGDPTIMWSIGGRVKI
jgi:RimJ/RimL family protein N-acetyltransferase